MTLENDMSNRHVEDFIGYYDALIKDILAYDPSLRLDMERDLKRIISSSVHRGVGLFLRDLPEIHKVLDQALSQGRLIHTHIPFMKGYVHGSPIPRLFKGIWLRLFTKDGILLQDIDPNMILFLRTLLMSGKKYEMEAPPSALYESTEDFYVSDTQLPQASIDWSDERVYVDPEAYLFRDSLSADHSRHRRLCLSDLDRGKNDQYDLFRPHLGFHTELLGTIQRVADIVSSSFGEFNPLEGRYRNGPGAVYEKLRGREKFLPPSWPSRLESQFPILGTSIPMDWRFAIPADVETPSRLIAVPKTIKTPRLIAAEPTSHLWCQFSIMDYLYSKVSDSACRFSINYRDQQPSRDMALLGSVDGSYATIDLKSASDRISLWLVERMFRANLSLLIPMMASRTQYVDLSIDRKLPSLIKLRKFTTQGSALTFPVQSIVFFSICVGVSIYRDGSRINRKTIERYGKQVRIFGDDIIVPKDWVEDVKRGLELLFLKVNTTKTHSSGFFRESCGMDAYKGYDVTPPYVNRFPSVSEQSGYSDVVEVSNNHFSKGYWHAAEYIMSTVPKSIRDHIPVRLSPDCTINLKSFSGNWLHPSVKKRWNHNLQVEQIRLLTQKVKKKALKVGGSRHLAAFLAGVEWKDRSVLMGHYLPLTFDSRWESRPVEGREWVTLS